MVPRILWASLTFSLLIYLVALWAVLLQAGDDAEPALEGPFVYLFLGIFGFVSLVAARMSIFLNRKVYSSSFVDSVAGKLASRGKVTEQAIVTAVMPRFQTTNIMCWAINEGICLFGFALAYMSMQVLLYIPFLVLGLCLNIFMFPRLGAIAEKARDWLASPAARRYDREGLVAR